MHIRKAFVEKTLSFGPSKSDFDTLKAVEKENVIWSTVRTLMVMTSDSEQVGICIVILFQQKYEIIFSFRCNRIKYGYTMSKNDTQ